MGSTQVVLIVISVIRTKYLAVQIGPEGFGLFSLLDAFFQLGTIFTGASLADASIKYIAEYSAKNEHEKVQKVFDFSFSFIFIAVTALSALFITFYSFFQIYFLSEDVIFWYYALFAASFVGNNLSNYIFSPLLTGLKLIKKIANRSIVTSVFNLITVVLLVFFFDLTGFFINVMLASFFGLYLFYLEGKKIVKVRLTWPDFKSEIGKKLVNFFSFNFFMGISWMGSNYFQRILIVNKLDMASLGLFSAALSLNKYLGIVIEASRYHTYPSLCVKTNIDEKNKLMNEYIRFALIYSVVASVFLICFAPYVIHLFYSKAFMQLADVYYVFVISQILMNIGWAFTWTIVGMAKMKFYSVSTIICHLLTVIIPWLMLKEYGLMALGFGFIIALLQHMLFNAFYLKKYHNIGINIKNVFLLLVSILIISVAVFLRNTGLVYKIILFIITLFSFFLTLSREERANLKIIFKQKLLKQK